MANYIFYKQILSVVLDLKDKKSIRFNAILHQWITKLKNKLSEKQKYFDKKK